MDMEPSLKSNSEQISGELELPDRMTYGIPSNKHKLSHAHPLEASESNYMKSQQQLNFHMLQRVQGIHAPLKLKMEQKIVKKIGRLPFLESSNALFDSLTGRDLDIGFEDIYNTMEFREHLYQPHAVMEKSLGLL
ncbi:proteasome maturation protein [Arctopsyche grandis]|uniref:proteasome maturation protein n=1 Tax=Arctopsyche grandis TaxID=121162 RepID=UPI00406D91CA